MGRPAFRFVLVEDQSGQKIGLIESLNSFLRVFEEIYEFGIHIMMRQWRVRKTDWGLKK
jgi:hypothetical protein